VRGAAPAGRTVAALTAARPRASAPHPRRSARARLPCGGRVARDRTGDLSNPRLACTFLELRGARFAGAFIAGVTLAGGRAVVQGLFRNPLADPSILGTTAGASLGGRLALLAVRAFAGAAGARVVAPDMLLPIGCLAGALAALALLLLVQRAGNDLVVLLLTGFLLSSLFASLGAFATSLAQERFELARAMLDVALGSVSGAGFRRVALATPLAVADIAAAVLGSNFVPPSTNVASAEALPCHCRRERRARGQAIPVPLCGLLGIVPRGWRGSERMGLGGEKGVAHPDEHAEEHDPEHEAPSDELRLRRKERLVALPELVAEIVRHLTPPGASCRGRRSTTRRARSIR